MPKINQVNGIDITREKFLEACNSTELKELELLITSNRYQKQMCKQENLIGVNQCISRCKDCGTLINDC